MENPYLNLLPKERKFKKVEKRLMKGCLSLLESGNSLETISVTDLCTASDVSRTSFYSCFQSIVDVLQLIEDSFVSSSYHYLFTYFVTSSSFLNRQKALRAYLDYLLMNKNDVLVMLSLSFPTRSFIAKMKNAIKAIVFPAFEKKNCLNIYLEAVASSTVFSFLYWLKQPEEYQKEDAERALLDITSLLINR